MADSTETEPKNKRTKTLITLNKWLVWRLAALCFWYWFIALRGRTLDLPILQYIGLFALLPVLRHLIQRKWWISLLIVPGAAIYDFIVFPFIGVYWCTKVGRKVFVIPGWVFRFIISLSGSLFSFLVFMVLLIVIPNISNPVTLKVLGYINFITINVLFIASLAWSSNPLAPILSVSTGIWKIFGWFIENLKSDPPKSKSSAESFLPFAQAIRNFLFQHVVDEQGKLRNIKNFRKVLGPILVAVVMVLFLILVSGYALTYYTFQKAGVDLLPGLSSVLTLGTSWYYSLTISITALHSGVIPTSSFGRFIQSFHLVNMAMFLASTLFLLSYAMSDRGRREIRNLRDYPRRVMNKLDSWIADLHASAALPDTNGEVIDIEGQPNESDNIAQSNNET